MANKLSLFFTIFLFAFVFSVLPVAAQVTTVSGRVTDAETGEGMPFVNVFFKGTSKGAATDFDGYYTLTESQPSDSLIASYVGYVSRAKWVEKGKKQSINFQLSPDAKTLATVTVTPKGFVNPAWEILERVMDYKNRYDHRRLDAYEYESYTKIELDIDNISEKFAKKRMVKQAISLIDSAKALAGEDGKPVLPIFISETLSDYYYRRLPERKREVIQKTKVTGVGVEDGTVISQLIGSTFIQYNFYKNWLNVANKDFVSPIADSWKGFYDYELKERNAELRGFKCFRIDFKPKRPQDLAFTGSIWITDSTGTQPEFALLQIDVQVGKAANLNFIDKIKVQQELAPIATEGKGTSAAWLPARTRVLVDVGDVRDDWAGVLAKSYVSNKNFVINQAREPKFYEEGITVDEQALDYDNAFWDRHRHDSLSPAEKNVYQMIDTIKKLPAVKTYVEVANVLINGYKRLGKVDVGTYLFTYTNNNVEGHRFRMGLRTNYLFSKKVIFHGMAAYGTQDRRWKYEAGFDYIVKRKPWTQIGFSRSEDYNQLALFADNFYDIDNSLFMAFTRFGDLMRRRPFWQRSNLFYVQTDVFKGLTQKIVFRNQHIDPLFKFEYLENANDLVRRSNFTASEIMLESRLAFGEKFIQNENSRVSLGTGNRPVLTFRYVIGLKNVMGSDLSYTKVLANITQRIGLGDWGNSQYSLTYGHIPSRVPYPMLAVHLGNETAFYNLLSFNMMRFFEFVSDRYVSLNYTHRFEGLFFNRIPLLKRLKWRTFATANVLWGSLSEQNRSVTPPTDLLGNPIPGIRGLGSDPYMEVGYGVENIFRFIRVDFLHRLTYLDNPDARRFGIKVSAQFRL